MNTPKQTMRVFIVMAFVTGSLSFFSWIASAQSTERANMKPSEAIVGRWSSYGKDWLGFGNGWKKFDTVSEYRPDHTLLYFESNGITTVYWRVLDQDPINGSMSVEVVKSGKGSHIKHIQFSSDRSVFYESVTIARKTSRRVKEMSGEFKHEYLGPCTK